MTIRPDPDPGISSQDAANLQVKIAIDGLTKIANERVLQKDHLGQFKQGIKILDRLVFKGHSDMTPDQKKTLKTTLKTLKHRIGGLGLDEAIQDLKNYLPKKVTDHPSFHNKCSKKDAEQLLKDSDEPYLLRHSNVTDWKYGCKCFTLSFKQGDQILHERILFKEKTETYHVAPAPGKKTQKNLADGTLNEFKSFEEIIDRALKN